MLATQELSNIKIGDNVKRSSLTKSDNYTMHNDEMIIYHVGKSGEFNISGKKTKSNKTRQLHW